MISPLLLGPIPLVFLYALEWSYTFDTQKKENEVIPVSIQIPEVLFVATWFWEAQIDLHILLIIDVYIDPKAKFDVYWEFESEFEDESFEGNPNFRGC